MTTHGPKRLSDYTSAGKWVLLFSHPANFTPVCTTEFISFARLTPEFERLGVQLIGLSIDWVRRTSPGSATFKRPSASRCGYR